MFTVILNSYKNPQVSRSGIQQEDSSMVGLRGKVLLASLLLLGIAPTAQAWWGWRTLGYGRRYYGSNYYGSNYYGSNYHSSYYYGSYYAPYYYYPAYPAYPICATSIPLAIPQAATPSLTPPQKVAEVVPARPTTKEPAMGDMMKKG